MGIENPFKKLSKPELYIAIGGTVLLGGFLVYKHHSSTGSWNPFSSGTSGSNSTAIDPVTGLAYADDNVTDPITGMTYLAEAQQYGSVAAAEASISAYGTSQQTGSGVPVSSASGNPGSNTNTTSGEFTTNDQWIQAVQAGLTEVGFDLTAVDTALQTYLAGQPLTPEEAKIVRFAIAEYGNPPVGSYQIILAPSNPKGKTMVKVPDVVNIDVEQATAILSAEGLKATGPKGVSNVIHVVTSTTPEVGKQVVSGSTVILHYRSVKEGQWTNSGKTIITPGNSRWKTSGKTIITQGPGSLQPGSVPPIIVPGPGSLQPTQQPPIITPPL